MTLKLVLDRYEDDIAVCLDFNDGRYLISKDILDGVKINDIFNIEFDGERFSSPCVLADETAEKKSDISKRMKNLFQKSRHRRPPKI